MATAHIALVRVTGRSDAGKTIPVVDSIPLAKEILTPLVTNVPSTITSALEDDSTPETGVWLVTVDVNCWVDIAATPDAATNKTFLVLAGQTRDFRAYNGQKVAVALA